MATALTCAAAVALSVVAAAPASADERSTRYTLEVLGGVEHRGETAMSWARAATLECDPAGGDHPRAEEACGLIAQHGDIASVMANPNGACTMEYRPVTVRVTGAEDYEETFGNACQMANAKGAIFDF
ncbi:MULTISPECIES: SSI family serine proteinase inhibitor [unclassified Nocardiopsis]|uniref:SSI family serine proteinase inhibitor n=1 Tax=unclassified Nocardiopsis TaxID=2649073 RepID=UPI0033FE1DD9